MAVYNLAVILQNAETQADFLLLKQTPPPKFGDPEYDSFVDSDLWDFPSTKIDLLDGEFDSKLVTQGAELLSGKINLRKFDFDSAITRVLDQVGINAADGEDWRFFKFVEEPDFGPAFSIHTIYVAGKLTTGIDNLSELCKWMSVESCLNYLLDVKPSNDRVGPLVVVGVINDSLQTSKQNVNTTLHHQEYPPGVTLVPMKSRTAKPFHTTNLVIFAPHVLNTYEDSNFVACGDALIVDPGCVSSSHEELFNVVAALPRKLVVFITHHHRDHVDGLSIIQKCNPGATLLAHENTMRRIGKDDWSLGYTSVSGGEDICIGGQKLKVIFAPGHTDGHVGLLHISTHSLIVGDHCLGQGSAVLDITSGGNMNDYFESTYKFIELAPHALIPMHGRVNLWPKHLLCAYLKNRRTREATILKAIEDGAKTLYDIVASVYRDVDRSFWIPASSNVQLHIDHLIQQNKLPEVFSLDTYKCSVASFVIDLSKI